jgi:hypothetical protein
MQVKITLEGQAQWPAPTNGCWETVNPNRLSIASKSLDIPAPAGCPLESEPEAPKTRPWSILLTMNALGTQSRGAMFTKHYRART